MKRRFPALLLTLALALSAAPPVQAAETGFSDVSPEDWFAPYVEVCAEAGLMNGVGDGKFAPERELTLMEGVVLAARLKGLSQGMTEFPRYDLPEDPNDLLRLYNARGEQVGNYAQIKGTNMYTFVDFEPEFLDGLDLTEPLTLTIDVVGLGFFSSFQRLQDGPHSYVGTYGEIPTEEYGLRRGFFFADAEDLHPNIQGLGLFFAWNEEYYRFIYPRWYRDDLLYFQLLSSDEDPEPFVTELLEEGHASTVDEEEAEKEPCFRQDLAALLYYSLDEEARPAVSGQRPPDTENQAVTALYQAGIFTGVDGQGTFHGLTPLTRAEAAAVLARALRPELRIGEG